MSNLGRIPNGFNEVSRSAVVITVDGIDQALVTTASFTMNDGLNVSQFLFFHQLKLPVGNFCSYKLPLRRRFCSRIGSKQQLVATLVAAPHARGATHHLCAPVYGCAARYCVWCVHSATALCYS